MRVERRMFYPKISQRSCYVKNCSCSQKVALHSLFNIKEFHAGFSTLSYTISKCILTESVMDVHYLLDLLDPTFDLSTSSRDGLDAFSLVAFRPFKPALLAALYSTSLLFRITF